MDLDFKKGIQCNHEKEKGMCHSVPCLYENKCIMNRECMSYIVDVLIWSM